MHMPRFADPTLCPDCHTRLPVNPTVCPHCALPLQGPIAVSLLSTLATADQLLAELRASTVSTLPSETRVVRPPTVEGGAAGLPSGPAPRRGLSAASVPKILLSLGALCLLVAAVTFLAVAWSWLDVGGRTAVLVALTLVSGGLGSWLARRGLRIAAESLTAVAFGLLALDVVGADNAGWLGDLSVSGLAIVVGCVLAASALTLALLDPRRLAVPQVAAPLGLWVATAGAMGATDHRHVVAVAAVLADAGLVWLGRGRSLRVLWAGATIAGTTWWAWLALSGIADAGDHATLRGLWLDGHGGGLLAASLLALLPLAFRPGAWAVQVSGATAAVLATLALAVPGLDDTVTELALVFLGFLLLWSVAAALTPRRWALVPGAPQVMTALPVLVVTVSLVAQAIRNTFGVGDPFTQGAGVRLDPQTPVANPALLVPLVLGLAVGAWAVAPEPARRRVVEVAAPLVVLAGIATLALYSVPLWTIVVALSVTGGALAGDAVRRVGRRGAVQAATGGLIALGSVGAALPSDWLTTAGLAVVVAGAAALLLAGEFPGAEIAGGAVLPAAAAAVIWSAAEVAGVDTAYRAAPILLVVGLLAIARPRVEVELSAALAAIITSGAAVDAAAHQNTSLALHLTLAGALVSASAILHPSRRPLGWLGGLLLAAATWVRLADLGVDAPEAYTLPSAVALVLVGLRRLDRDPGASTLTTLAPGLLLATTPSLLWLMVTDPVSVRALLLGLGCLGLVLAGVRLRWNAPLVIGGLVGGLLVLRELGPYAAATPQWVLIGLAGTLLTVVGVTWESRMQDLRHATAYLGRLR